jgi:hypothetical protein
MKNRLIRLLFCIAIAIFASLVGSPRRAEGESVKLLRVPQSGLQPQAMIDGRGVLHLIYFLGEPQGGNLYYVQRSTGKETFSPPIRINNEPNCAIAVGTIRGAHMALGKNGRVHIAWNGPQKAGANEAPMFYTRLNEAGSAFEAQRNLMHFSGGLDGGGSVAADHDGGVFVAWHGRGEKNGEEHRRVWLARSTDEGKTFAREVAAWNEPTGACGCCGLRAFADRQGRVHFLYRAARKNVNRDMYLLTSADHGLNFSGALLDKWRLDVCPMSSASLADSAHSANGLLAAWETKGQVYFASFDPSKPQSISPIPAPGATGNRKHPVVAVNSRGETLIAWTEGTGWKKGGSLAWRLYDPQGKPIGENGKAPGVPVWSLATVVSERNGGFTIIY